MYFNIIDSLYHGDLRPGDLVPNSVKRSKSGLKFEELTDRFQETLCPKQQEEFDETIKKHAELWCCESRDMFYTGFCLGARIMMEVMQFEER